MPDAALDTVREVNVFVESHPDTGCRWSPRCLTCPLPECLVEKRGRSKEVNA